jgi:hypothetical protein
MDYAELNLYSKYGGSFQNEIKKEESTNKIIKEKKQSQKNNYEKTIKLYKKKIIEQRNEIERLKTMLEKHQK